MFYFLLSVGAVAKFSSFGFAKRWLVCRAKPKELNVPLACVSAKTKCAVCAASFLH